MSNNIPGQASSAALSRSSKSKTGIMAIGSLDRELKELGSTRSSNFAHLIHAYSYRKDQIPAKLLSACQSKGKSLVETLCRLNERACKKAGLEEVALTWKSVSHLGQELHKAKQLMSTFSQKTGSQTKVASGASERDQN